MVYIGALSNCIKLSASHISIHGIGIYEFLLGIFTYIFALTAPGTPVITNLTRHDNTTATVSWFTEDTGGHVVRHTVTYEPLYTCTADLMGKRAVQEVPDDVSPTTAIIYGLDPNVAYEVIVTAYNSEGNGTSGVPKTLEREFIAK